MITNASLQILPQPESSIEGALSSQDQEPEQSASELPMPGRVQWTKSRLDLLAWLRRNAPSLAELYVAAVTLLYVPIPGRVRLICHAVREIMNRLPNVLSGEKSLGWIDYKTRIDAIAMAWKDFGLDSDGLLPPPSLSEEPETPAARTIVVPPKLVRLIGDLVRDHTSARERPYEAAARLFEACAPENKKLRRTLRPILIQWVDTSKWFMRHTHDSGLVDADVNFDLLTEKFELFERTLGALISGFFNTIEGLDAILEEANT